MLLCDLGDFYARLCSATTGWRHLALGQVDQGDGCTAVSVCVHISLDAADKARCVRAEDEITLLICPTYALQRQTKPEMI